MKMKMKLDDQSDVEVVASVVAIAAAVGVFGLFSCLAVWLVRLADWLVGW